MFTGIVESVSEVVSLEVFPKLLRFSLLIPKSWDDERVRGESVAINGVCLTVVDCTHETITCEAVEETLEKTTLGLLRKGSFVNVERACQINGRNSGHVVLGHCDGRGEIIDLNKHFQGQVLLEVHIGSSLMRYVAPKGSIAIDGISLTVIDALQESFTVAIVPHTYTHTIVQYYEVHTEVNIEIDVFARYVVNYLRRMKVKDL